MAKEPNAVGNPQESTPRSRRPDGYSVLIYAGGGSTDRSVEPPESLAA
ncbi:hypothetical protein [Streptomyces liangshanensis]